MVQKQPDFTVTTDIIVGFPGESEADFAETLDIVRQVAICQGPHVPLQPAQTDGRAALYPNRVPAEISSRRKQELLRLAEKVGFDLREKFVGRTMAVLLENSEENGSISGHTENFLRVILPAGPYKPNDIVTCQLIENTPQGLIGTCV